MTTTAAPSHERVAPRQRVWPALLILATVLALVAVARLFIGSSGIGFPAHLSDEALASIWRARLFRLELAVVVGAALSVSGVALQALLRNPLAEPYILGLSTGAAAGIMAQGMLFYALGLSLGGYALDVATWVPGIDDDGIGVWLNLTISPNQAGALLGAALSMFVVFLASRRAGIIDPLGLLLTGVVLSTINGALVMMLNYLAGPGGVRENLARWMMGYLNEGASHGTVGLVALLTLVGLVVLASAGRSMDIATLTESEAQSLGVHLSALRTLLFVAASVLAAGAVLLAGPLAFVGLICPHVARLLLGPSHGPLVVGAALAGASLILLADLASAVLAIASDVGMMPIGIFTAMVGGPVFLWMLRPHLGRGVT